MLSLHESPKEDDLCNLSDGLSFQETGLPNVDNEILVFCCLFFFLNNVHMAVDVIEDTEVTSCVCFFDHLGGVQ